MIFIPDQPPAQKVLDKLTEWQDGVNAEGTFAKQVEKAKNQFASRNKKGNATFDAIKKQLTSMCSGARRCNYCEDSVADEVEHIYPKKLYPEKVFEWENYLYACGPCNGPKNDSFAVFRHDNGSFEDITPPKTKPVPPPIKPVAGDAVLINPRVQNPLDFLMLDLLGTFFFVEIETDKSNTKYIQAEYTNMLLKLNQRDILVEARKGAYGNYKARLYEYVGRKNNGETVVELNKLKDGLLKEAHPTVWKEMQRQHSIIPELKKLFDSAPEALTW